jgi:uncharacterized damage-inducible protein DinB
MSIHTGKGVVMTYYGAQQLADSFQTVRNNTLRIAEEIPQDKYSFRAAPDTRTVEKTLVHIALSYKFQYMVHAAEPMSTLKGINFLSLIRQMEEEEGKPRTRAEVIVLLRKEGEVWTTFLRGLTEEFLAEQVEMPSGMTPASRSRFEMILSVKEHEMHHRGQLMLMQRMLGMVPPLTRDMQARLAQAQKQ